MAIFRQGIKVGPFDLRAGVSRGDLADSAYHKTDRDIRLRSYANRDNTIGRFRAAMAKAEGYARQARYMIRLFLPTNLEKLAGMATTTYEDYEDQTTTRDHPGAYNMHQLASQMGSQINLHCDSVSMPGHDLQSETITTFGPPREVVTGHGFTGTINASFYADKFLRERQFMELWQKRAVGMIGHKAGYYKDYIGKMHIYQLGSIEAAGDRDVPTYAIEATEVYPAGIGSIDYSYTASSQLVKVTVQFQYKQWYNLATDKIAGIDYASSKQVLPDQAGQPQGIFGKLPIDLQRVGRDAMNQGKTQLNPIGRLTKGKVFGPFTL